MKSAVIIPARWGSTRFPGKPLVPVLGTPVIERVAAIAQASGADEVCVATDDSRIFDLVSSRGIRAVMTSPDCRNGSERVYDALPQLKVKPDIIINFQGDAVLTPPWVLRALLDEWKKSPVPQVATPAVQLSWAQYEELRGAKQAGNKSGTLVVFGAGRQALYFSRSMIPDIRTKNADQAPPVFRHIGIYAYTPGALQQYLKLEPGVLEKAEQLEQLRLLEAGIEVRVVIVSYQGRTHWSIDTPEDVLHVEDIIRREGELL